MPNCYSPTQKGALCGICPLGPSGLRKTFVPPEIRSEKPMLIGEAPGSTEEEELRPFVGASGAELARALKPLGLSRYDVSINNAILCRPGSDNNLKNYLARLVKKNKERKAQGLSPIPSPIDCCRPRLLKEIYEEARGVLALGAAAFRTLAGSTGSEKSMSAMRGFPLWLRVDPTSSDLYLSDDAIPSVDVQPFMATYHPAFILRKRKWTEVLYRDIAKFFRHCSGTLNWTPARVVTRPTLSQIREAFAQFRASDLPVGFDVETDGKESTHSKLRCLGIGTSNYIIVIPFLSIDGVTSYWSDSELPVVVDEVNTLFADPNIKLVAQNGQFDKTVLERYGFKLPNQHWDTIIAHHVGKWSEMQHDLDYLSSFYTDAKKHKFGTKVNGWDSDDELWKYNAGDVQVTAHIAPLIAGEVRMHSQGDIYRHDLRKQEIGRQMTLMGMGADIVERDRHVVRLERAKAECLLKVKALLGRDFNLGSPDQMKDFLFVERKLDIPRIDGKEILTPSGEPSASREAIEALLDRGVDPLVESVLYLRLDYGEADKMLGTFAAGAKIWPDDRVRPSWFAHTVPTGRFSSSDPNAQNIPAEMRSIYRAKAGNIFIACDKAQLELRLIAWLAQDQTLIKAFLDGLDVHLVNAAHLSQKKYEDLTSDSPERQLAKTAAYAMGYGCTAKKLWKLLRGFYDVEGKRPYATLRPNYVQWLYDNWFKHHTAIKDYHKSLIKTWQTKHYIESAILGRRRYFLDAVVIDADYESDKQVEALYNFPIQATGADTVDLSTFKLVEALGWNHARCTGLFNQMHDALYIEVPEKEVDKWAKILRDSMTSEIGSMPLPCDLKVGYRMIPSKTAKRFAKKAVLAAGSASSIADQNWWQSEEVAWNRMADEGLKDYKLAA